MTRFNKKYLIIFAGLLLTINIASSASVIGEAAPDFALPSLHDGNLRLSEYRSEVVVLAFWASWCMRCNQAMPLYKSLYLCDRRKQSGGYQEVANPVFTIIRFDQAVKAAFAKP
jgi:thiol-disulfide isomerase/thioredoxin